MSLRPALAALVITLAAPAAVTNARHAFAPVYDAQRMVAVQGIVTEFRFINPHAMIDRRHRRHGQDREMDRRV